MKMPSIAIVDDRQDKRETLCAGIDVVLEELRPVYGKWSVVSADPPQDEGDLLYWLDENDATVLLTDWRLNEGAQGENIVQYEADALIRAIRARRPSFPIFVVTGFEPQARLHLKDVENVFSRENFTKNIRNIIPQVLRAGLRRYEQQRKLLKDMDDLARKVAKGVSTNEDVAALQSLGGYFQAELPTVLRLVEAVAEFERIGKEAEALRERIRTRIAQTEEPSGS